MQRNSSFLHKKNTAYLQKLLSVLTNTMNPILITIPILSCIASSQELSSFTITTDSINPGDGSQLSISIFWNTNQYNCTFNPKSDQTNTPFTCDISSWKQSTITANQYIQYYLKIAYSRLAAAMQFSSVQLVDITGATYSIKEFCIR